MARSAVQIIDGQVVKALKTWNLVQKGDRILLGASGGKDSAVLAHDLARKRRQGRLEAELCAVHIRNDFSPHALSARLAEEWGIPLVTIDLAVSGRLQPGRSLNCYWCSTQRRTELIRYALSNGFNSLALGHHLDDVLETLFMNMLRKGQLSTMPPLLKYHKYPLQVIRPLYLLEEAAIIAGARELGLIQGDEPFKLGPTQVQASLNAGINAGGGGADQPALELFTTCTCGYNDHSERDRIRQRIDAFVSGLPGAKLNLLASLHDIRPEYLP